MLKDKFKHLTHDSYKPAAHPIKEVTTIQDNGKNYFLVPGGDELQLKRVLNHLSSTDRFAFDFESNTNDPMDRDPNAKIVGVSFAWAKGQACYLPIAHKHTEHNWPVEVLQRFKPFFESDQLKVAHHIKFERHWLKKHGIVLALPGFDTMLALNLMKKRYDQIGLKPAVYQILNHVMLTFKEVVYYDGNENRTFDEIPLDAKCLEYTCADSDEALQLVEPLTAQLKEDGLFDLFNDLDVPLAYSLVDIEQNGWYVDRDLLRSLGDTAEKKIAFLSKAINLEVRRQLRLPDDAEVIVPTGKVHKPLNLNSTKHLAWLLYDQLKLPVLGKTDTGNPKVDADILEKLGMRFQIPLFDMILEYKKYQKINSTYVKGYGGHVREDNRLHTTLDMVFVRCIAGDTLIPTNKGLVEIGTTIKDVGYTEMENIEVYGSHGIDVVASGFKAKNQKTKIVKTKYGFELEGTLDHPIIAHSLLSQQYHSGRLTRKQREKIDSYAEWRKLSDVKVGDYVALKMGADLWGDNLILPKYKPNKNVTIPQKMTPELARFIGYYISDGSVSTSNGSASISISNDDPVIQKDVKNLIKILFNREARIEKANTTMKTVFSSKYVWEFLKILGLERGAKNKEVPACILSAPRHIIEAFLQGVFVDSAITSSKTLRITYSTVSKKLAKQIHQILLTLGYLTDYSFLPSKDNSGSRDRNGAVYRVGLGAEAALKFNNEVGFIEPHKQAYITNYKGAMGFRKHIQGKTYAWVKVVSVGDSENDVYDFVIPKNHSFVGNGFVNHNTGRFSSSAPNLQNCFSQDTEILTPRGWVFFPDLTKEDDVAQWDNGNITFVKPLSYVKRKHPEKLIHLKNQHIDLCLTAKHRCLLKNRKTDVLKVVSAESYKEDFKQLHSGFYAFGDRRLSPSEVGLLAMIQADGSYHDGGLDFSFSKVRKQQRFVQIMKTLEIPYTERWRTPTLKGKKQKRYRVLAHPKVEWAKQYLGPNKTWGAWVLNFSRETIDMLLREVFFWDGCWTRLNHYSSSDKTNADWIQILHVLSGKRANLREYWNGNPKSKINYQLDITHRDYSLTTNISKDWVSNDDFVYCVEVPSSFILVRRNGKTAITGNCPRADNDPIGIRNVFVAPSKEKALSSKDSLLLFSDYAQIELKIFAWYSGDPKMREAFFTGQDIHSRTAWEMFELGSPFEMDGHMCEPITVDEVKSKAKIFRQYAKAINFGIIYGLSAKGLAEDLWQNSDDEHVRRAQGLLNRYFERYRRIIPYQTQTIATARNLGYAETMFGRVRLIPEIQSRQYGTRGYGERMALNTPIQGSASEIIKLAMVEIWKNRPVDLSMIMQIHDEIVTETPAESLIRNARYIKQAMEVKIPGFDIPIIAECDVGYRWGEKRGITFTDNGIKVKVKPTDEELVRRLEMAGAEIIVAS